MKKSKELMKFQDCVKTMSKDIKKHYKYGDLIYEAVNNELKEQLKLQIVNSVEASIDTINYFLEKKDINKAQNSLEWLKKEIDKLLKILEGKKYW